MFDSVDAAIQRLLKSELNQETAAQVAVSLATPAQNELQAAATTTTKPLINVFLFDIREDRDLRVGQGTSAFDPDSSRIPFRAPDRRAGRVGRD